MSAESQRQQTSGRKGCVIDKRVRPTSRLGGGGDAEKLKEKAKEVDHTRANWGKTREEQPPVAVTDAGRIWACV
jgi:hypothetical protein